MSENETVETSGVKTQDLISASILVVAVTMAAFLRLYQIDLKPLHHDEGVNSYFLLNLYNRGEYKYDPTNYHGPTLYYFALLALWVWGKTELALRFWPAIWGVLSVGILWLLRRWLGSAGLAVAATLMAVSPGLVYFSRDFIHESSFGFFTLGIVVGAWCYVATRRFIYLALAAISAALLFATKETAVITAVVLLLAALCAALWDRGCQLKLWRRFQLSVMLTEVWQQLRGIWPSFDLLLSAAVIFIFINIVFYSSFFTNWRGVAGAFESIWLWVGRGTGGDGHEHAFHYYLGILMKLELPLLIGGLLGTVVALWRRERFGLFLLAWSVGIVLTYSLIPYKTPWLTVSMLIPLALLTGYAAQEIFLRLPGLSLRLLGAVSVLIALILSAQLAYQVNFDKYDDNSNSSGYLQALGSRLSLKAYTDGRYGGYVYAQTERDLLDLMREIEKATSRLPTGKETDIYVASPEYWPLPWYLREYSHVAYAGTLPDTIAQPVIIAREGQQEELEQKLSGDYRLSFFSLRPGVELVLYVRQQSTNSSE
jgi:uncharacterized protein (TIGR03663 family)